MPRFLSNTRTLKQRRSRRVILRYAAIITLKIQNITVVGSQTVLLWRFLLSLITFMPFKRELYHYLGHGCIWIYSQGAEEVLSEVELNPHYAEWVYLIRMKYNKEVC